MRQEETSKQNKKVKGKKYVQAGTLTSMAYKRVSSLRTKETVQPILPRNSSTLVAQTLLQEVRQVLRTKETVQPIIPRNSSTLVAQTLLQEVRQVPHNSSTLNAQAIKDQMQQVPQSSSILKAKSKQESVQQVPLTSSTPKTQVVQKQVQHVPMNSPTIVAQVAKKRLQHVPRESSTVEAHDVQDKVQQEAVNLGEDELSREQDPLNQKKTRGSTVMNEVHGRQERKLVVLNRYNQPIGPINATVTELSSFLVTLARNAMLCPLNIHNWKNKDTKEDLWEYTQEKYDIPDSAELWALDVIKSARRKYKNDLYRKHYKEYDNDDLRMANKPKDVSESDFKDLLKYWDSEKFKKMSETNTKNRKQWKNPHTVGKTSFAVIRDNLEKEKENPDELSSKEIFVATRSRKPDRTYKDSNEDTISKIAEMEKIQCQPSEDDSQSIDAFTRVMGPEHPGCLRLYGRGVTKTTLKRKAHSESFLSATEERMQKQMEELEERMHQRMAEKLEQQKVTVTDDILGRINRMCPGLQLNTDMLAAMGAHSPQEAIQPNNRPSSSNNNQGGEDDQEDDEIEDLT